MVIAAAYFLASLTGVPPALPEISLSAQPLKVGCEAGAGRFSITEVKFPASQTIRAKITMLRADERTKWFPAAGLLFKLPGTNRYAGIQAASSKGRFVIGLRAPGEKHLQLIGWAPLNEPVYLKAHLQSGLLTVEAGDQSRTLRIEEQPIGVGLMCSSGSFEFDASADATPGA